MLEYCRSCWAANTSIEVCAGDTAADLALPFIPLILGWDDAGEPILLRLRLVSGVGPIWVARSAVRGNIREWWLIEGLAIAHHARVFGVRKNFHQTFGKRLLLRGIGRIAGHIVDLITIFSQIV